MEHLAEFDELTHDTGKTISSSFRWGRVSRVVEDPDEWRRVMRRQARADKIRITTLELERRRDGRAAVAARKVEKASFEEVTLRIRTILAIAEARERARLRGHPVGSPIRVHSGRAAARCSACDARVYVDASAEPAFAEGEVFEEECSGL